MIGAFICIVVAATIAFALSALCGGGAGLVLMPLLGLWLPISEVPAALSLGTFSSSATRLAVFYRHIDFRIVRRFVPAALPAVILGVWLLRYLNPIYLSMLMGLFLVGNLPFLFRKKPPELQGRRPQGWVLLLIGAAAGFLSGLTGAVGLIFNRFYFRYGLSKDEIVATRAANEILLHLIKLVLYGLFGLLHTRSALLGFAVALAGVFSSLLLRRGLAYISEQAFRRIGYLAMVASGFLMLYQSAGLFLRSNQVYLSLSPLNKGTEATLQWQDSKIAFEFSWNDGLEYERVIPVSTLSPDRQRYVQANKAQADQIVVEEVRELGGRSFEAYYFRKGNLVGKIEFQ